jgi:hypothetical protein
MMMKRNQTNGFWQPGFGIFHDELAKQEKTQRAPLETELKETLDAERKVQLKQEIAAIKAEYRIRRKNARHSLFAKT